MELITYKLGDCFSMIENGVTIKQKDGAGGYPITRIETLSNDKFNRDRLGYADIFDLTPYSAHILDNEDLIMSHINSRQFLGRTVIYLKKNNEKIIHGMNVLRIKTKREILNPYYAYYYFKTPHFKKAIDCIRTDAINQSSINTNNIKDIKIHIPNKSVQEKIVAVMRVIDKRIELNETMNAELEAMAKQLYDYWFVQFDFPDENGRPYKSSGGKMVYNSTLKREIPAGWEVLNIFEVANVLYGFPFSTESFVEIQTEKPVVRIRDIANNSVSAYTTEDVDEIYKLNEGDLVIGMDGNFHMNFWHNSYCYLNQRCVRFREKKEYPVSTMQMYYDIKPIIDNKQRRIQGSTVGHLLDSDIKEFFILCPHKAKIDFKSIFDSLLFKITDSKNEIINLTNLRDSILPMLMNGQVTVE